MSCKGHTTVDWLAAFDHLWESRADWDDRPSTSIQPAPITPAVVTTRRAGGPAHPVPTFGATTGAGASPTPTVAPANDTFDSGGFASRLAKLPKSGWKLASNDDGIEIRRQSMPGFEVDAIQSTVTLDVPATAILAVIADQNRAAEWMPNTVKNVILEQPDKSRMIAYNRTGVAGPFVSDRDVVLESRMRVLGAAKKIEIIAHDTQHPNAPKQSGVVRIPDMEMHTVLEVLGPNKTRMINRGVVDPGGSLPGWVMNVAATEGPKQMAKIMRTQAKDPSYANKIASLEAQFPQLVTMTQA